MKRILMLSIVAVAGPIIYNNGATWFDSVSGSEIVEEAQAASLEKELPQAVEQQAPIEKAEAPQNKSHALIKPTSHRSVQKSQPLVSEKNQSFEQAKPAEVQSKVQDQLFKTPQAVSAPEMIQTPTAQELTAKEFKTEPKVQPKKLADLNDKKWLTHIDDFNVRIQEPRELGCSVNDSCFFDHDRSLNLVGIVMTTTQQKPFIEPIAGMLAQGNYLVGTPAIYLE